MSVIEVRGLTKRFGQVLAVDRLSFTVEAGEVVGFLGPNGAGKTTTLRMLLGLVRPDEGTATINGGTYADLAEPLHQVGAVLEASSFHPGRTARNHLRVQALAGGRPVARRRRARAHRAQRGRRPQDRRVLARHAAAPRPGHRAAQGPGAADS